MFLYLTETFLLTHFYIKLALFPTQFFPSVHVLIATLQVTMVYVEMMLGKHVNWATMTTHSRSQILRETIDIPSDIDWNWGSCTNNTSV
jgi:hypothetical protein